MTILSFDRRLRALEQEKKNGGMAFVWREAGETVEQAIIRRFNGNLPANTGHL